MPKRLGTKTRRMTKRRVPSCSLSRHTKQNTKLKNLLGDEVCKIFPLLTWKREAQRRKRVSARAILGVDASSGYCNHSNKYGALPSRNRYRR